MNADKVPASLLSGGLDQFLNQLISGATLLTIWAIAVVFTIACFSELIAWPFMYRWANCYRITVTILAVSLITAMVIIWLYLGYRWLDWLDYRAQPSMAIRPSTNLLWIGNLSYFQFQQLLTSVVKGMLIFVALVSLHMTWLLLQEGCRLIIAKLAPILSRVCVAILNWALGNRTLDNHGP